METPNLEGFQLGNIETSGYAVTLLIFYGPYDENGLEIVQYLHLYECSISSCDFAFEPDIPRTESVEVARGEGPGRTSVEIRLSRGHLKLECADLSYFRRTRAVREWTPDDAL
jgi:hypothetical protein